MTALPPPRPPVDTARPCAASSIQSNESVSEDKQTTSDEKQGISAAPAPSAQHKNSAHSLSATPTLFEDGFHQLAMPEVSRGSSRSSSQSSLLSTTSDEDGNYSPGQSAQEDEDDEEDGKHTRRAWQPHVVTRTLASGSTVTYGGNGNAWEEDEDRLLVKLVQRLGKEWQKVGYRIAGPYAFCYSKLTCSSPLTPCVTGLREFQSQEQHPALPQGPGSPLV